MSTVVYDGAPSGRVDPWNLQKPVRLSAGQFVRDIDTDRSRYTEDAAWMPFLYMGELYFTQSIIPHLVLKMNSTGVAMQQWVSPVNDLFPAAVMAAPHHLHGGPPHLSVDAAASGSGQPYYLGVMRHLDALTTPGAQMYRHYAYKIEPEPPFRICAVSTQLPLRSSNASGALPTFVGSLQLLQHNMVHMSYSTPDMDVRMLSMPLAELESLFIKGNTCSRVTL